MKLKNAIQLGQCILILPRRRSLSHRKESINLNCKYRTVFYMLKTSVMEEVIVIVKVLPFYVSFFVYKALFLHKLFVKILVCNHYFW